MSDMRRRARWVAAETVVSSPVGSEVALLDTSADTYFTLNGTGARIWSMLETPATVPELSESLSRLYGRSAEDCRADVEDLLAVLNENGLVRRVGRG